MAGVLENCYAQCEAGVVYSHITFRAVSMEYKPQYADLQRRGEDDVLCDVTDFSFRIVPGRCDSGCHCPHDDGA